MFQPNQNCVVHATTGQTDVYGMPVAGVMRKERCAIIKLNIKNQKSAVRADTSASRGNARELESDAELLLTKTTVARVDDMIDIAGVKLRITARFPRHDLQGNLDHIQVACSFWGI